MVFRSSEPGSAAHPRVPSLHDHVARILLDQTAIRSRIEELARELSSFHRGRELTLVAVLKGAFVFVADLIRLLPNPVRVVFVAAESYRDGTDPGELELTWTADPREIAGRRVLVVDDILDSGRTLLAVRDRCVLEGAAEVKTCVFLDKPERRTVEFTADFVGFEVEDEFVVGYGLDHGGCCRNLPYVGALKPELLVRTTALRKGP